MDSSVKSSLVVSDLTQTIKTSTSGSSLYLKTLPNKSSGIQPVTSLSSSQMQSQPSVVKVIPATSVLPVSAGSSRSQQYSLFSSSITCDARSTSNAKQSNSSSSDQNSMPKVYVSLSGLSGQSSKPPIQLMAGDALSLPTESGNSDTIGMLGLDELPPSSEQLQSRLELETDENDSCIDMKDLKAVEHKTFSDSPQLYVEPNEQNIKCNLSTSLANEDSASTLCGQSTLHTVNSSLLEKTSVNPDVMRQLSETESQLSNLEPNLNSSIHPCPTSFLDHGAESLSGQDSGSLVDQSLLPHGSQIPHLDSGQISASDVNSESKQHSYLITKPYSQPPDQSPPTVHESLLDNTWSEESQYDNSGGKMGSEPDSVLSSSPPPNENPLSNAGGELAPSAPSCSVDISKQSAENTTKDIGGIEGTKDQMEVPQSISQSKRYLFHLFGPFFSDFYFHLILCCCCCFIDVLVYALCRSSCHEMRVRM